MRLQNKKGYTLIEMMFCLVSISVVLVGAFTLYAKWHDNFYKQDAIVSEVVDESNAFVQINEKVLKATQLSVTGNTADLGNCIISINTSGDLMLNGTIKLVSEKAESLYAENGCLKIVVGGDTWCFKSINTLTLA